MFFDGGNNNPLSGSKERPSCERRQRRKRPPKHHRPEQEESQVQDEESSKTGNPPNDHLLRGETTTITTNFLNGIESGRVSEGAEERQDSECFFTYQRSHKQFQVRARIISAPGEDDDVSDGGDSNLAKTTQILRLTEAKTKRNEPHSSQYSEQISSSKRPLSEHQSRL